jgi:hypothetical protein
MTARSARIINWITLGYAGQRQLRPAGGQVALIRNGKNLRQIEHGLFSDWVFDSHRRLSCGPAPNTDGGCGKEAGASAAVWLPETTSGTHNEFRISANPLSGDWGARASLLIYTRGGSKKERDGSPLRVIGTWNVEVRAKQVCDQLMVQPDDFSAWN